jgi:ankyrin repeat protein
MSTKRGKFNRLPLHVAVKANDVATTERLLKDADALALVNEKTDHGHTAIFIACQMGFVSLAVLLHNAAADLNLADNGGLSPMHIAARNGHLRILQFLVSNGGNPNQLDTINWSPLHWSLKNEHDDCCQYLTSVVTEQVKQSAFKEFKK